MSETTHDGDSIYIGPHRIPMREDDSLKPGEWRLEPAPAPATPRTHELKTWPEYFEAVLDGRKPFEIRLNDRGFRVGDRLHLREYLPDAGTYTGRAILARVSYMTNYAQRAGYVVMGLAPAAESVHLYGSWTVTGESE